MSVNGVVDAQVSYEPPHAVVAYRPAVVTVAALVRAVEESGFTARTLDE